MSLELVFLDNWCCLLFRWFHLRILSASDTTDMTCSLFDIRKWNERRREMWPPPPIIQPVLAWPPGVRGPGNEFTLLPAEARAWQSGCAYQAQRSHVNPGARVTNDDTANILRWMITPTYTTYYTNLASNAMLISLLCFGPLLDHLNHQNLLWSYFGAKKIFVNCQASYVNLLKIENYVQILNNMHGEWNESYLIYWF